jgi:hypothetical protein
MDQRLPVAAVRPLSHSDTSCCPLQSRVSPAWETIGGAWHIFLMLATPLHTVTVYEVSQVYITAAFRFTR